jgi:hypothetical protein
MARSTLAALLLVLTSSAWAAESEPRSDVRLRPDSDLLACPSCKPCGDGLLVWAVTCPEDVRNDDAGAAEPDPVPWITSDSFGFAFAGFLAAGYFLPSVVARLRNHERSQAIFAFNVFFGWTGLGWLAALIWAFTTVRDFETW